jgi:hypothetical protein
MVGWGGGLWRLGRGGRGRSIRLESDDLSCTPLKGSTTSVFLAHAISSSDAKPLNSQFKQVLTTSA